jgi:Uma2 family endonuclease
MAPPGHEHSRLAFRFGSRLGPYVEEHDLGDVSTDDGFRLASDPDTVRSPDLAFVRSERLPEHDAVDGFIHGSPDLVVEVISPNDLYTEVDVKVGEWLAGGARLVVVVNPRRRTVAVHRPDRSISVLGIDDVLSGEDVVPGWTLPVRDLFDRRGQKRS